MTEQPLLERIWDFRVIHPILAASAIVSAAVLWVFRFAFTRHREFIVFTAHMSREEKEVWPALQTQIAANHAATMKRMDEQDKVLHAHGERIAALEGKMPNGDINAIKRMVEAIYERRTKPREDA